MSTGFINHPDFLLHEMGLHHPESPDRLRVIEDQLILSRLDQFLVRLEPSLASEEQLELVHSPEMIALLRDHQPSSGYFEIDGDTYMNPNSYQTALRAAGSGITAVDAVMSGHVNNVFCAVRPPGHHAEPNRSMGFCLFNNMAIAARYALEKYKLNRIALIDFDVHHGNGTEKAFEYDPQVLMCGIYQHPFYPYSGGQEHDNMINIPVPAYTNGVKIRDIIKNKWLPKLHDFQPEFIFISAGFDAHKEDDLGQLGLVEADYIWITEQIMNVAALYAQGRIVSCLEGGYNLSALARSVAAHIKTLASI
ncbi:MAG: histone deacetylase family protein [Betaproteobacteria bacterium]|jgi:acetoin utilization deacetylase AcuC-like enzyme